MCLLFFTYSLIFSFFFNDPAPTEIYTLSLHDALPISPSSAGPAWTSPSAARSARRSIRGSRRRGRPSFSDRKSTRLNSSHSQISYAVFCLKKKKKKKKMIIIHLKKNKYNSTEETTQ